MRKSIVLCVLIAAIAVIALPVLAIEGGHEPVPVFDDGRINNFDSAAPVAVYGTNFADGRGLEMWAPIGYHGAGVLVLRVTPDEIAAVPANPSQSTLIDATEDGGVKLYRLPGGEYQLWALTNKVEWYCLTFGTLGQNTGHHTDFVKGPNL